MSRSEESYNGAGAARLGEVLALQGEGGDEVDWEAVETVYNVRFPQDYKEFVATFGEGAIENTLWIAIPTTGSDPMARRVDRLPEEVLEFPEVNEWADSDSAANHRLEDLLIWGETSEADILGWLTCTPEPEKWPLAVFSRAAGSWSVYACSMSEFCIRLFRDEFEENPISTSRLSGLSNPRFEHT